MLALFACANPFATIYLYAVIPVPAWLCVTGAIAFDTFAGAKDMVSFFCYLYFECILTVKQDVTTDHAGHVAGILSGIAYYLALRYRIFLP